MVCNLSHHQAVTEKLTNNSKTFGDFSVEDAVTKRSTCLLIIKQEPIAKLRNRENPNTKNYKRGEKDTGEQKRLCKIRGQKLAICRKSYAYRDYLEVTMISTPVCKRKNFNPRCSALADVIKPKTAAKPRSGKIRNRKAGHGFCRGQFQALSTLKIFNDKVES